MTEKFETLLYEVEDGILRLVLNRPESGNSISKTMTRELSAALARADRDRDVRSILMYGAGRCFSTGADLAGGDWAEGPQQEERRWPGGLPEGLDAAEYIELQRQETIDFFKPCFDIADLNKPVIAAVHGWCLGGGATYAFAADLTLAADDAVFGEPAVRQGAPCDFIWATLANWKNAMRYGLTGDHFDAPEALRIGLLNEVVPASSLMEKATALAARLAALPTDALRLNKAIIRRGMDAMGYRNAMMTALDLSTLAASSVSQDVHGRLEEAFKSGGLRSFVEARDGPFLPEPFGPRSRARGQG